MTCAVLGPSSRPGERSRSASSSSGPIGDCGWTYEHNQGRLAIEQHFGDKVETVYQNVAEGADAERALTQMALGGAQLIFTTSFGYMDPTSRRGRVPGREIRACAPGSSARTNVATYNSRFHEGRAVLGTIAGQDDQVGKLGYLGSFPIPEVVLGVNIAYIHARKENPDVELRPRPTPGSTRQRGRRCQGPDRPGRRRNPAPHRLNRPASCSEKAGNVYGFGQASDMAEYKPKPRITAIVDNWGPYYIERVQALLDGTGERPTGTASGRAWSRSVKSPTPFPPR